MRRDRVAADEYLDWSLERGDVIFQVAVDDENVGNQAWLETASHLSEAAGPRGGCRGTGDCVDDREATLGQNGQGEADDTVRRSAPQTVSACGARRESEKPIWPWAWHAKPPSPGTAPT